MKYYTGQSYYYYGREYIPRDRIPSDYQIYIDSVYDSIGIDIKPEVAYENSEYTELRGSWAQCRDAYEGEEAIKAQTTKYLHPLSGHYFNELMNFSKEDLLHPRFETMKPSYLTYLQTAVWPDYVRKTVDASVGTYFYTKPQIELPDSIEQFREVFTSDGRSLEKAAQKLCYEIFLASRPGIYIRYPKIDENLKDHFSKMDAERLNHRPYATIIPAENIINWRTSVINGREVVSLVVLAETYDDYSENEFGGETKEQFRVLALDAMGYYYERIYREEKRDNKRELVLVETDYITIGGKYINYIPFIPVSQYGITFNTSTPLMNGLVNTCVHLYNLSALHASALQAIANPMPVLCGYDLGDDNKTGSGSISISRDRILVLPSDGKADYLQFNGNNVKEISTAMDRLVAQAAVEGARIAVPDAKTAQSAETARIHRWGEQGVYVTVAKSVTEALGLALTIMAEWSGLEVPEGSIMLELNTDLVPDVPMGQDITQVATAPLKGVLPYSVIFEYLRKYKLIPPDMSFDKFISEMKESAEIAREIMTIMGSTQEGDGFDYNFDQLSSPTPIESGETEDEDSDDESEDEDEMGEEGEIDNE